ncbi:beta-galactosidase trimerization domain-containing protein [Flavihumibacter profundi]|uniref:beta-galactosidase trimerization domain-containing protein n=1 Tax=Flavihumibacter profundi TaxID=2716883 RepID=UPI001CC64B58|nr:beta-galactosidase trimerization domain-containing protein [Flavihumibacter profundi]MBZ5856431.1 beta-galactosidase trimerization domain-containing protein [Flavihumibacter profundi]
MNFLLFKNKFQYGFIAFITLFCNACKHDEKPLFTHEEVMAYVPKGPAKCFRQICLETNSNVRTTNNTVFPPDSVFATFLSETDPVKYADFCEKINLDAALLLAVPESGYATYRQTKETNVYPGMKGDFFGETLKELHKRKISGFGYICIGWQKKYSMAHPEYTEYPGGDSVHPLICLNSPYRDHIMELSREVLGNYPVDGLRYDILDQQSKCRCAGCQKLYAEMYHEPMPVEWPDWQHRQKFRLESIRRIVKDLYQVCKSVKPSVPVWQNWYDGTDYADITDVNSVDMAYLEFANPFRELFLNGVFEKEGIITGKVIENPKTRWKCLALGGKCYSYFFTDDKTGLPVDDKINKQWLENDLAKFYAQVRDAEEYFKDTKPVTNIAIIYNEQTRYHYDDYNRADYMKALRDITEPLLASGNPVRFISAQNLPKTPLEPYKALVIPETSGFSDEQLAVVKNFAEKGGHVIITGDALSYNAEGNPLPDFALGELMGVTRKEKPEAIKKVISDKNIPGDILKDGILPANLYTIEKPFTPVATKSGQTISFIQIPNDTRQPLVQVNQFGKGVFYYVSSSQMPEVTAAVLNYAGVLSPVKNDDPLRMAILSKKTGKNEWILHLLDKGEYFLRIDKKYCPATKSTSTYPANLKNLHIEYTNESIIITVKNDNDYAAVVLD